jgi:hypothetical protein
MLADVAWARAYGTSRMLFPSDRASEVEEPPKANPYRQQLEDAMPAIFYTPDPQVNCGNCINFDPSSGECIVRPGLYVKADQPSCPLYVSELGDPDDYDE